MPKAGPQTTVRPALTALHTRLDAIDAGCRWLERQAKRGGDTLAALLAPLRQRLAATAAGRWLLAQPPLRLAIAVSLLLHALLLILHFAPAVLPEQREKGLEVVLVNSKTASKPSKAQALAQANLDGGGNTEAPHRASTPLPPSRQKVDGNDLEQTRRRVQELEQQQQQLLQSVRSKQKAAPAPARSQPAPPTPELSGHDLASRALAMARLEGVIEQQQNEYNQRPRRQFIGSRTSEYRFARYIEEWRQKVERVGTMNFPAEARGKHYGSLIMTVAIRADGTVEKVEINKSSGLPVLDQAARRIATLAAPYAAFPPDIRRDTAIIEITRTWYFTNADELQTK